MVKQYEKPVRSRFKELFPEPEPKLNSKPDREISFDDLKLQEWETDVARGLERKIIEWEKSDCPKSLRQDVECKILYFEWEEADRNPRKVYRTSLKRNPTIPGSIYTSAWEENPLEALSDLLDKVKSGHDPNPPDVSSSRNGIGTVNTTGSQLRYLDKANWEQETPIAQLGYATPGDGNPANGTVAHQNYLEPDLNWWDRRRCARIQGTIKLRHFKVSRVLTKPCGRIDKFIALDSSKHNGLDVYFRWREEAAPGGKEKEVVALLLVAGGERKTPKEEMWSKPSTDASKALKNLEFRVNERGRMEASSVNGMGCTKIWQRKLLRLVAPKNSR